jgi:hypothetical protein
MIENDSKKDDIYLANVAKLGSSAKNVYVVNNFLSNEEHKELSNYVNNPNEVCWIREPWSTERTQKDSIPENILKLLKKIFQTSRLNSVDYYGIDLSDDFLSQYLLTKWSKGSKMLPHVDTDAQKHQHIVCMYYINDDYDGGEIYFPEYGISIKPEPGDLLTFPDNPNFVHGVRPIISGVRYTTPRWFTRIV